jgi:ABC-type polysaccharide/polyol phosphate export permease
VIVVAVIIGFGLWRTLNLPLALAGLALVLINISWMCLLTAIISARFRDIPQIVMSIMQFSMFMTPVFWQPGERVGLMDAVLTWNPFFHMLDAIRAPLMGAAPEASTFSVLVIMALGGWVVAFGLFTATRRRIVHYL